jgi:predicted regulator of Ras-like GTPase activity (Roadblock/LC7/MglB family)
LSAVPEAQAAAVVSFDGLPMASVLPSEMDEDRVAAMSAALLSLGERASQGLGRGELSQVFVEGENGTVFLIACESEAVLVIVADVGAKKGLVLYEARRSASSLASILRDSLASADHADWLADPVGESDIFAQALADAEAAYQAHRSETWLSEPLVTDSNVIYTPIHPNQSGQSNPSDGATLQPDWLTPLPPTDVTRQAPSVENPIRWDVR